MYTGGITISGRNRGTDSVYGTRSGVTMLERLFNGWAQLPVLWKWSGGY